MYDGREGAQFINRNMKKDFPCTGLAAKYRIFFFLLKNLGPVALVFCLRQPSPSSLCPLCTTPLLDVMERLLTNMTRSKGGRLIVLYNRSCSRRLHDDDESIRGGAGSPSFSNLSWSSLLSREMLRSENNQRRDQPIN